MKKILTVVLCLLVAISSLLVAGCSSSSVFDGNYTEVEQTEINTFASTVEDKATAVDFSDGIEMTMKISFPLENQVYDVNMNFKTTFSDDILLIEGNMSTPFQTSPTGPMQVMKADFWCANGNIYMKANYGGQELKIKQSMDIDEFINEYTGSSAEEVETSLSALLEKYAEATNVKYFLEQTETLSKAKIEIPELVVEGQKIKMTTAFVYDAELTLTAVMMDLEMTVDNDLDPNTEGVKTKTYISIQQWQGTINLPSDLSSYLEIPA